MTLEIGNRAPDFTLASDTTGDVTLSAFRGHKVVLYFYPKDMTPGCTTEACDFNERYVQIQAKDAILLGVSPDSVTRHAKFREKHALQFPLLADEDHAVAEAYGVWVEKKMYGKTYWGVERATFLIDEQGHIANIWRKVKVKGHADAIVEAITD
ncbi:MAG: thioredoxin-dependent thiol peroxidase [Bacilli bacterium]